MTRWCPNLCKYRTSTTGNSYWTMAAGKVSFVKNNSSSVSYFVVVRRLSHNTSPSYYLKNTCEGEIFHLPLRLSTLKFSCGPSTTLNIRQKGHWLLNNQPVGVLHSLNPNVKCQISIPLAIYSFLSKVSVYVFSIWWSLKTISLSLGL